jgi:hypothetical protein
MKDQFLAVHTDVVVNKIIPKLPHENDGLIYTKDSCPYYPGTC